MDINTCFETTNFYHSIAYYSHLIPAFIALVLSIFALVKTGYSLLSKVFFAFTLAFCLWLIGDVILWTVQGYDIVVAVWAPMDYINILFYLFGAYFFFVLIRGKDITTWAKLLLFGLSLPAWYLTFKNETIPSFNQTWCEAFNSDFLTQYKLTVEGLVVIFIVGFAIYSYKKVEKNRRRQIITVGTALILFFGVFSITEYISSQTGIYEINLYSLFVLPLFLGLIIYSVTNLQIFKLRSFVTQLMVYVLLILVGSQFFFLESTTDKTLTVVTFVMSLAFCYLLIQSVRREAEARKRIEALAQELQVANEKLKSLDRLKTEFISLVSHQIRSPLTAIKGYASLLNEDSYGKLTAEQDTAVKRIYTSAQELTNMVEDFLNVSKIEQGGFKYEFMPVELAKLVNDLGAEMKIPAESKGLELKVSVPTGDKFAMTADPTKIKQVFLNLVDNSIKYTKTGFVEIGLERKDKNIIFYVKDSGIGMTQDTKEKLFHKFSRGTEGGKINTGGSGLGLYLAQEIAKAHKGNIEADSEGLNRGTTFTVTLPSA